MNEDVVEGAGRPAGSRRRLVGIAAVVLVLGAGAGAGAWALHRGSPTGSVGAPAGDPGTGASDRYTSTGGFCLENGVCTGTAIALPPSAGPVPGTGTAPEPGPSSEPGSPTDGPTTGPFAACAGDGAHGDLVPFTPVAVRSCHLPVDPSAPAPTVVDRDAATATGLAGALAALPDLASDVACPAIGGESWALLFTAADGSTAAVTVDAGGCRTASNATRTVAADDALFTALDAAD